MAVSIFISVIMKFKRKAERNPNEHFSWWTEVKDHHKHELGFRCTNPEIEKVKWISLAYPSVRGSTRKSHDWPSRTAVSDQERQVTGLPNVCLCSKVRRKMKIRSMQSRSGWKLAWFSCIHHSWVSDNRREIMPTSYLGAIFTKRVSPILTKGSTTFLANRYNHQFTPSLRSLSPSWD